MAKVEELGCLLEGTSLVEALRYTPAKQRAIQDARKAEGWTYEGEVIQGLRNELQYVQGAQYLERIVATAGDTLTYAAHEQSGLWLLDREEVVVAPPRTPKICFFGTRRRGAACKASESARGECIISAR